MSCFPVTRLNEYLSSLLFLTSFCCLILILQRYFGCSFRIIFWVSLKKYNTKPTMYHRTYVYECLCIESKPVYMRHHVLFIYVYDWSRKSEAKTLWLFWALVFFAYMSYPVHVLLLIFWSFISFFIQPFWPSPTFLLLLLALIMFSYTVIPRNRTQSKKISSKQ